MTDRERWGLRGAVSTCRLQRTWYWRGCVADACETEERSDEAIVEFSADGATLKRWHRNHDGSECTVGADQTAENFEYDASGRKKKTVHVDVASQRPDTHYGWSVEGTDTSYSAPGAATITTFYNDRDQPSDLLFYSEAGELLSGVQFTYDLDGNLIEEAQKHSAQLLYRELLGPLSPEHVDAVRSAFGAIGEFVRRTHCYDSKGRRIESDLRMGLLGGDRKTMAYNDYGDLVEEVCEDWQRDYEVNDAGRLSSEPAKETMHRSEARFHYEYDARGNWLRKTVESRTSTDQDFTISSIERRTIGYFKY
jgi:hypothetical protein